MTIINSRNESILTRRFSRREGAAPREDARAKNIGYAKSDQAQPDQCPAKLLSARSMYREKKKVHYGENSHLHKCIITKKGFDPPFESPFCVLGQEALTAS